MKRFPPKPLILAGLAAVILCTILVILVLRSSSQTTPLEPIDTLGARALRPLSDKIKVLSHEHDNLVTLSFEGVDPEEPRKPFDSEEVWHAAATIGLPVAQGDIVNFRYHLRAKGVHPVTVSIGSSPRPEDRELHRVETTGFNGYQTVIFPAKHDYEPGALNVYIGMGLGRGEAHEVEFEMVDLVVANPEDRAVVGLMTGNSILPPTSSLDKVRQEHNWEIKRQANRMRKVPVTVRLSGKINPQIPLTVGARTISPDSFSLMMLIRGFEKYHDYKRIDRWEAAMRLKSFVGDFGISPGFEFGDLPYSENSIELMSAVCGQAQKSGRSTFVWLTGDNGVPVPPEILAYTSHVVADPEIQQQSRIRAALARRGTKLVIPVDLPMSNPSTEEETYRALGKNLNSTAAKYQSQFAAPVILLLSPRYIQSVPQVPEWKEIFSMLNLKHPFLISSLSMNGEDNASLINRIYYLVFGAYQEAKGRGVFFDFQVDSSSGTFLQGNGQFTQLGLALTTNYQAIAQIARTHTAPLGQRTVQLEVTPGLVSFAAACGNYSGRRINAQVVGGETIDLELVTTPAIDTSNR